MTTPTQDQQSQRVAHEIEHGQYLAAGGAEDIWGWGTPAGKKRAERRARLIGEAAGLAPGVHALEIGCGTGNFTERFATSGASIIAVDLSEDLLKLARDRQLPTDRITFVAKPFEECAVDGPFDAIIGSSVLHHLDLERSLPRIFGLLKPGGRLSFAEPNMLNPQVYMERHWRSMFPYVSPDETAFVRWRFAKQLRAVGFENVHLTPFDWLHPSTPRPLIPIVRGIGAVLEFLPGVREFAGSLVISATKPNRNVDQAPIAKAA
jgi:2-polyprenyl-3-methyl-5-hydroxy-6-metoxy-1,4-benzoquinol methylase